MKQASLVATILIFGSGETRLFQDPIRARLATDLRDAHTRPDLLDAAV
jgi:hypothetical protein